MSKSAESAVIHLYLSNPLSRTQDQQLLEKIASYAVENGVSICVAKYLEEEEHSLPPPR